MLYKRALHPELFSLQGRRTGRQPEYEIENWIIAGGHIVRFQVGQNCLVETVIERGDHLPETGLVHALPCLGEKDYDLKPANDRIGYVTTIQTETLTDNLYMATYREMVDFAQETGALAYQYTEETAEAAPSISILDVQRYKREYHIQSYHLVGSNGLVLRTQSIFERL